MDWDTGRGQYTLVLGDLGAWTVIRSWWDMLGEGLTKWNGQNQFANPATFVISKRAIFTFWHQNVCSFAK